MSLEKEIDKISGISGVSIPACTMRVYLKLKIKGTLPDFFKGELARFSPYCKYDQGSVEDVIFSRVDYSSDYVARCTRMRLWQSILFTSRTGAINEYCPRR